MLFFSSFLCRQAGLMFLVKKWSFYIVSSHSDFCFQFPPSLAFYYFFCVFLFLCFWHVFVNECLWTSTTFNLLLLLHIHWLGRIPGRVCSYWGTWVNSLITSVMLCRKDRSRSPCRRSDTMKTDGTLHFSISVLSGHIAHRKERTGVGQDHSIGYKRHSVPQQHCWIWNLVLLKTWCATTTLLDPLFVSFSLLILICSHYSLSLQVYDTVYHTVILYLMLYIICKSWGTWCRRRACQPKGSSSEGLVVVCGSQPGAHIPWWRGGQLALATVSRSIVVSLKKGKIRGKTRKIRKK